MPQDGLCVTAPTDPSRTHPTLRFSPCWRTRAHTSDRFFLPDLKTATSYVF